MSRPLTPQELFVSCSTILIGSSIILIYLYIKNVIHLIKFRKSHATNAKDLSRQCIISGRVSFYRDHLKSPIFNKICYGYLSHILSREYRKTKILKENSESVDFILETSKGNFLIEKRVPFLLPQLRLNPRIDDHYSCLSNKPQTQCDFAKSKQKVIAHYLREYCITEGQVLTVQGYLQPAKVNGVTELVMAADKPITIYEGDYNQVKSRLEKQSRWLLFQCAISLVVLGSFVFILAARFKILVK